MKPVIYLKFACLIMAGLFFGGVAFLFSLIADKKEQSKLKQTSQNVVVEKKSASSKILLNQGEFVEAFFACGNYICAEIKDDSLNLNLIVVAPETGAVIQRIDFEKSK